jgi:integrase
MARGKRNRLTARQVSAISKPGRHADGGCLYLNVSPTGAKSWVFLFARNGRQRELGLGSAFDVPLARAREIAAGYRLALAEGLDPATTRRPAKVTTFGEAAEQFLRDKSPQWSNERHRAGVAMTLHKYAAPLRDIPVDRVSTEHVLASVQPLWMKTPATARRLRGRIENVLNWATAKKLRSGENPARWRGHLDHLLPRPSRHRAHHPAMPIDEMPPFMAQLRGIDHADARLLEITILAALRSNEARGARWDEINLDARVWTLPAARMKARREHRVPLSDRALEILKEMAAHRRDAFVFAGAKPGKPRSPSSMARVLGRLGVSDATAHGFRSSFRDWAAERTAFPNEVCEAALAHVIENESEAAYRRGDLLERRRPLMAAWAGFCAHISA